MGRKSPSILFSPTIGRINQMGPEDIRETRATRVDFSIKGTVTDPLGGGSCMAFIGIDLHTDRFTLARLESQDGRLRMSKATYGLGTESFGQFLKSLSTDDYVLIENTVNAFWFHDQIADRVAACYVYDTNELRTGGNKTD